MTVSKEDVGAAMHGVSTQESKTTLRQNARSIFFCSLVSLLTMQYGLDLSVINGAMAMRGFLGIFGFEDSERKVGYGIDPTYQSLITSFLNVGIIMGSFALSPCGKYLGRRRSFLVGSVTAIAGITTLVASTNRGAVVFGRFLVGFSNGIFTGMANVYLAEAAPSHLRGALMALQQLSVNLGTIVGKVVNNATKNMDSRLSYQIPLFVIYVIPVLAFFFVIILPESPRWLVVKGRPDEARQHLVRLRGKDYPEDIINAEMESIRAAVEMEQQRTHSGKLGTLREMMSHKERKRTGLTFAAGTMHAATGFPFVAGYSTYFFQVAGSADPFRDGVILACVSLLGAIAGVFMNKIVGRRPMLMSGFASQAIMMLLMAAVWTAIPNQGQSQRFTVAIVILYQTVFSCFCGPTPFIVGGEIPSNQLRAATYGYGAAIGFVGNLVITLTTPYYINPSALNLGPQYGYIWFGSNLVALIFVIFCIPETLGRTLEEIDELFYRKVPVRKFKDYKFDDMAQTRDVTPDEFGPKVEL